MVGFEPTVRLNKLQKSTIKLPLLAHAHKNMLTMLFNLISIEFYHPNKNCGGRQIRTTPNGRDLQSRAKSNMAFNPLLNHRLL